ncbi:MAG: FAD-binding oxidoreductase [Planctomycetes bacterium]|nr:FAD-binding oxidoreductase [Planctomycetota bacterium]
MTGSSIRARAPRGEVVLPTPRDVPEARLLDAAYFPGGRADVLYEPSTEGHVAAIVCRHASVLVVGAQSSLTGGATPDGGALLVTDRLDGLAIDPSVRTAVCGAGVVLSRLRDEARPLGLFCGAAPTWDGATLGGMASTNAAGAATFKHGTMRRCVRGLTVVLADGSVLDLRRGEVEASADGHFDVVRLDGTTTRIDVPTYRDPAVPKVSAGYFAAPAMDLVDLFIGSEGTLGVVTEVVVELAPLPAASVTCWLPVDDETRGFEIVRGLRDASIRTRRTHEPNGLDVPAIEHFDRRCVELLRDDGADRTHGVPLPANAAMVLIFTVDLPTPTSDDDVVEQLSEPDGPDTPLRRLVRILGPDAERLEIALPSEPSRAAKFAAMREAVPMAVNHRIRDARLRDPGVTKTAGDLVVPWDLFPESIRRYRENFAKRGVDLAIWGHVSDGNVHPNALPQRAADVAAAKEALLESAAWVVSVGGSPLSEHGVGRSPMKQAMLRLLRGAAGIEQMRAVKQALDPAWKLAPGVLFPR